MIEIPIPATLKVGGIDYEIKTSLQVNRDLEANNSFGDHSMLLCEIRLRTDSNVVKPQRLSEAFLHETIHAINVVYNEGQADESTVSHMSHGLLQVFEQLGIRFVVKDGS